MKTLSSQAQCAHAIRKELKKHFPQTKFSVTSEGYSMGDNVRVKYKGGPSLQEIKNLLARYEYGSFDGMHDIYNNDNIIDGIPQTKYLFIDRERTEDEIIEAKEYLKKYWQITDDETAREKLNCWYSEALWQYHNGRFRIHNI